MSATDPQKAVGEVGVRPAQGERLTVATWNVHNQYRRADEFRAEVERVGADVVLLQEAYDRQWLRTFSDWHGVPWHDGWIFTRRPIVSGGKIPLGDSWRPGCWARLRVGEREVAILSVHVTAVVGSGAQLLPYVKQAFRRWCGQPESAADARPQDLRVTLAEPLTRRPVTPGAAESSE